MTRLTNLAPAYSAGEAPAPLTSDDLLSLENAPPTSAIPPEIEEQLASDVIHISTSENQLLGSSLTLKYDGGSSASLPLPRNAFMGRAVRTVEFFNSATLPNLSSGDSSCPAFGPAWFPHIIHPKYASASTKPILKSFKGNTIKPEILFPPENRSVFFPQGYPWHCVGRLFIWRNASSASWDTSGTAVLVGHRVILTCSHLLPVGSPSWKCLFVPGYFDGAPVAGAGAASWVSDFRGFTFDADDQAFDMAVMRLYDPLGGGLGFFGAKSYSSQWQDRAIWSLIGYPGAIANAQRPSIEQGIRVLDDDSDGDFLEIEHRGDTNDGNSGGPLFGTWPDGFPYVIGTHSGGEQHPFPDYENHNVAAGGKGMVNLINWARNTWQ